MGSSLPPPRALVAGIDATERLYYTDAYLAQFRARVVHVDGARVCLARTAFYPTSGGQPHDTGTLGGAAVIDVMDEGDQVAHLLAEAVSLSIGAEVEGSVDWARRFDHMQQHTGQHLLSAVFEDTFGSRTVSVHFGDLTATLDLAGELLRPGDIAEAERRANEVVFGNRAVLVTFEDAAQAKGLRKPTDRAGEIRVVSIEGLDRSACGGTHVRHTGEIGPIMMRRVEKYKQYSRVEFVCGRRAVARGRRDFDELSRSALTLSSGVDEVATLVAAQAEKLHAAEAERRRSLEQLAGLRAAALYQAAAADSGGARRFAARVESMDELRLMGQAVSRLPLALFVGSVADPPSIVLAASEDTGINAGAVLKGALAALGGRGGGSPRVAQGTISSAGSLDALVQQLLATEMA